MDTVERKRYEELFDLYIQMGKERNAAIARAEAAEKRIAELEARLKDQIAAHQHTMNGLTEYARQNYAQSLRITELQAQLAAQEWRPVTEPPIEAGYYQAVNDGIYEHCYYGPNGWEDYYLTPTHWRPLTDPPLTGES